MLILSLDALSEALKMFLIEQIETELASVLVQNQNLHELVHYNSFICRFFASYYSCVMHNSKKTVPIRSIHSITKMHTVNTYKLQNNELVKSLEARIQIF